MLKSWQFNAVEGKIHDKCRVNGNAFPGKNMISNSFKINVLKIVHLSQYSIFACENGALFIVVFKILREVNKTVFAYMFA